MVHFALKPTYENIVFKPLGNTPIRQSTLTDDQAIQLIAYHPKGYGLFKEFPNTIAESLTTLNVKLVNHDLHVYNYPFNNVVNAINNATGKVMIQPTPYKLEKYFPKLSTTKRNAVLVYLD